MVELWCVYCGRDLSGRDDFFRHVVGWERSHRGINGQSGSSLVLRQHDGAVACVECVTKLKHGVSTSQASLL